MKNLYDIDYTLWLQQQIQHLNSQQWEKLDVEHLIVELEALNKSNKRELYSYCVVLLAHLLKWQYQPLNRNGSWEASINNSRRRIERLFRDQPSLKPYLNEMLNEAYEEAKEWAQKETKLSLSLFPGSCPFCATQLLDLSFLPD